MARKKRRKRFDAVLTCPCNSSAACSLFVGLNNGLMANGYGELSYRRVFPVAKSSERFA